MSVIAGEYLINSTKGYAVKLTFTFYAGADNTFPPFDFTGKQVFVEVVDPLRNRIVRTHSVTIVGNAVTLDVPEVSLQPGHYEYRVCLVQAGRKKVYIKDKWIVDG